MKAQPPGAAVFDWALENMAVKMGSRPVRETRSGLSAMHPVLILGWHVGWVIWLWVFESPVRLPMLHETKKGEI